MSSLPAISGTSYTREYAVSPAVSPRWYAIRVRPRHEKKAASLLSGRGIQTFLPLITQSHRWSDRQTLVELPLFPCYAFVRIPLASTARHSVLQASGVLEFVGIQGQGLPIPDKQIEDIQAVISRKVLCGLHPFLREGQRVRVRGGCLDGLEGILTVIRSNRAVVISVGAIQHSVSIRVEGYDVEPI